jgi:plasmid stabilization system protein ParE
MAIQIRWSTEAEETFDQNVSYLLEQWSDREVEKFVQETNKVINRIQLFPESYPPGKKKQNYRRAKLNKYIALIYRYNKASQIITLTTFWGIKRNPSDFKY